MPRNEGVKILSIRDLKEFNRDLKQKVKKDKFMPDYQKDFVLSVYEGCLTYIITKARKKLRKRMNEPMFPKNEDPDIACR